MTDVLDSSKSTLINTYIETAYVAYNKSLGDPINDISAARHVIRTVMSQFTFRNSLTLEEKIGLLKEIGEVYSSNYEFDASDLNKIIEDFVNTEKYNSHFPGMSQSVSRACKFVNNGVMREQAENTRMNMLRSQVASNYNIEGRENLFEEALAYYLKTNEQ